jgi:hypothetical protein
MVDFKGPSQEKSTSKIFRFGYRKAVNDKKVPDPVGSGKISLFRFLLIFFKTSSAVFVLYQLGCSVGDCNKLAQCLFELIGMRLEIAAR